MKHTPRFFCHLMLLTISCSIFAQGKVTAPVDNGLPYLITTSVYPLNEGGFEMITFPQYSKARPNQQNFTALNQSISYGITDSFQAYVIFIPYAIGWLDWTDRESGVDDINFGYQKSWMYIHKSTVSASFEFNVTVPTGDINKRITSGFLQYTPTIILAKDFLHSKFRAQFFSECGVGFRQRLKEHSDPADDLPPAHYFLLNSGVSARFAKVNYTVEFNWLTNTWNNGGKDNQFYITPSIMIQATKNVGLALGVAKGTTATAYKYQIIANLVVDIDPVSSKTKKDDKDKKQEKTKKNRYIGTDEEKENDKREVYSLQSNRPNNGKIENLKKHQPHASHLRKSHPAPIQYLSL